MGREVISYDPTNPEVLRDPFPHYRQLRECEPVHFVSSYGQWAVAGYDDCVEVLRDTSRFSSERGYGPVFDGTFLVQADGTNHGLFRPGVRGRNILATDPPIHTAMRKLAAKKFTVRAIGGLEGQIRARADRLVDRLVERTAAGETVDLVADFASPIPFEGIIELMGIPEADTEEFRRWVDVLTFGVGAKTLADEDLAEASSGLCSFFDGVIESRRARPGDDLISALVDNEHTVEPPLSAEEITAFAVFTFTAGTDTTTGLLANWLAMALETRPDVLTAVRAEPALIPGSIEEMLRFENSNQAVVRQVTEDVVLSGVDLAEGSGLIVLLGSANRDARHFGADAEQYRIDRNPVDALGFGGGAHLCLGGPLTRLECRVALESLCQRAGTVAVAGDIGRHYSFLLRAAASIPALVGPA